MQKYLINSELRQRVALRGEQSANKIAQLPGVAGNIGKTGILELLRCDKASVKGWRIAEDVEPKRANKAGVEFTGTGTKRHRLPMKIYVSVCKDKGLTGKEKGDFAKFLNVAMTTAHDNKGKTEYGDIQAKLGGWSRNMISVYAARARHLGYIQTQRESNRIGKQIAQQA